MHQGVQKLILSLHPLERKLLPFLKTGRSVEDLVSASKMSEIEVVRAMQWLSNKNVVTIATTEQEIMGLDENGEKYAKTGLPERIFLKTLQKKQLSMDQLAKQSGLDTNEVQICIGLLKQKGALITTKTPQGLGLSLTQLGEQLADKEMLEEQLIKKIAKLKTQRIAKVELSTNEQHAVEELAKRKQIIKKIVQKTKTITLTDIGKKLTESDLKIHVIEHLTPEVIQKELWKTQPLRPYDVTVSVPPISGGKRHFVNQAMEYIKQIWLDLGFKEMTGDYVQTSFWNLDALYIPQDHPARQMQDTFFIGKGGGTSGEKGKPMLGSLPKIYPRIKGTHEHGADTGSTGWQAPWSEEEAQKLLLRTHTTVLSAQTLAKLKKEDLPAKFFNVGAVFRNEALDWSHLFEFHQVDGIVIDPHANLKHLKGYLKEFFGKMGYPNVRMRPAHFPYTEPSVEVDVFHPVKKTWIELGGAGIFRPEVVKPLLGYDVPVLAWGLGLERIVSEYFGITDIRDLYKNDLKQMKEMKLWLK